MHRSSSGSRVSEEFLAFSSQSAVETEQSVTQQLPTYNPFSDAAKKEKSRLRSSENAIHIIPLILVFCAVVLWFFSNPETRE